MNILMINQSQISVPRKYLDGWLRFVHKELVLRKEFSKKDKRGLTILFLDSPAAREMNLQFRGKDYPTDILSFVGGDPESFGDLAICSDVAKRQSLEQHLTYRDELAYLILHGWLHLLGYEHENGGEEAREMYALQDQIFAKIDKFRSLQ